MSLNLEQIRRYSVVGGVTSDECTCLTLSVYTQQNMQRITFKNFVALKR